MAQMQASIDCPNPCCAAPALLDLCVRFSNGFGLQVGQGQTRAARWDDTHCLVCGQFSSPYAGVERKGQDLRSDSEWLHAVEHGLVQARATGLSSFLALHDMGVYDLLAMRYAVQGLRDLQEMAAAAPTFPQVGRLRVQRTADLPEMFGISHGEAESDPFVRKVRVLGRLLGAQSAETSPRHCKGAEAHPAWYFYTDSAFIGLLHLEPNRGYRGHVTIDGCLDRLLHTS
jgi:hypothetical protein